MGAAPSKALEELKTQGKVDSKNVEFEYIRNVDQTPPIRTISWREPGTDNTTTIDGANMIVVMPVSPHFPDDYSLLYVSLPPDVSEEIDKSKLIGQVHFRTLVATRLPSLFIHDFSPSGLSCWQTRSEKLANPSARPNLTVILSTGSGHSSAEPFYRNVLAPALGHMGLHAPGDYSLHTTTSPSSIAEITKSHILPLARRGVYQAIVLLSGDGGVHDIVNALASVPHSAEYQTPNIALLPMGTGNALANSTHLNDDNTAGLSTLMRGAHKPLPLFRATFSPGAKFLVDEGRGTEDLPRGADGEGEVYGAVVCSWGLHAALVADSDTAHYRQFGAERFQMAAKENLYPGGGSGMPHAYRGRVSVLRKRGNSGDGREREWGQMQMQMQVQGHGHGQEGDYPTPTESGYGGSPMPMPMPMSMPAAESRWETLPRYEHAYVLATLASQLERGFTISPASRPLQSSLRLVHFGPLPGDEVMRIMGLAYQEGKHIQEKEVGYEEIEGLRIEFDEEDPRYRRVCLDGRIVGVERGGWVEVRMVKEGRGIVDLVVDPEIVR